MVYKGSVAFSAGCRSGCTDGVRSLEVMLESLEWREEAGDTGRRNSYGSMMNCCVL